MTTRPAPADRALRWGAGLTAFGMITTLVAMSPAVTGGRLPAAFWPLSMTTGVGLIIMFAGLRRASRARTVAVRDRAGE